ncbi:hypothetical protein D9M68_859530 [compost metagenome]
MKLMVSATSRTASELAFGLVIWVPTSSSGMQRPSTRVSNSWAAGKTRKSNAPDIRMQMQ